MSILTEKQKNQVKKIAENEKLVNYELETKFVVRKADGALSNITAVNIISDESKLDLILKFAETNPEVRNKFPIRKAYLREIHVYEKVFPEFCRFMEEHGLVDKPIGTANIYASCTKESEECLVLENLQADGYKKWNKTIPMTSAHVSLVVSEYAKFHALSFAMKEKKTEVYKQITDTLDGIFAPISYKELVTMLTAIIPNNATDDVFVIQSFKKACDAAEKYLQDLRCTADRMVVIHGDCWSNNMMFKYEDPEHAEKPTKVCLFDWQLSKMGSPVMDLADFLFVNGSKQVLDDHKKYLKLYHDTLSSNLKQFRCDPNVFSASMFEHHWQKYAKNGLYAALFFIKLMLSEPEEIPDLHDIVGSGKIADRMNFSSSRHEEYRQRILDIVSVMAKNNLL